MLGHYAQRNVSVILHKMLLHIEADLPNRRSGCQDVWL